MKTLLWHLGLGDAIICAPIAVKLAQEYGGLRVPCYRHNEVSVRGFFINHPEIEVYTTDSDIGPTGEYIPLGFYAESVMQQPFNTWFYKQLGLDYEETVKQYCPLQKAAEKIEQIKALKTYGPYLLVHDDAKRGFDIMPEFLRPDLPAIRVTPFGSILEYAELLKNAAEIHCIDSSFIHLADRLESTGKLYYHKYARPGSQPIHHLKHWTTL